MNRSLVKIFFAFLVAALLAADSVWAGVIRLTEKDDGHSQEIQIGDVLEVLLDGNPTTGYIWELGKSEGPVLNQKGEPEYQALTRLIGSGGTYAFRFEAVQVGETSIELIYHRTFEKDVPPAKTFKIKVIVQKELSGSAD